MDKAKRKCISPKMRWSVLERDNHTCQYCGASAPDVTLEIDHIIPVASGGNNSLNNLITACKDCNRGKGKIQIKKPQRPPNKPQPPQIDEELALIDNIITDISRAIDSANDEINKSWSYPELQLEYLRFIKMLNGYHHQLYDMTSKLFEKRDRYWQTMLNGLR